MSPHRQPRLCLLAASVSLASGLSSKTHGSLRGGTAGDGVCFALPRETAVDDIAYAMMVERICHTNWVLAGADIVKMSDIETIGCWKLKVFNTDSYMTSGVYQHENDGRCTLAFSGYHGKIMGPKRAIADTVQLPPRYVEMCNNSMYEPFVKLLRHHTELSNWSTVAAVLGGPNSTCTSVAVTAMSMGGSVGEMLASCANGGGLAALQKESLPSFKITKLYTFGSIAASSKPLVNPLRSDGCFDGKRVFLKDDIYAGMGRYIRTKHARMEAMEIFHTRAGVSSRTYDCQSDEAVNNGKHRAPPASEAMLSLQGNKDFTSHEATTYKKDLETLLNISWEDRGHKGDGPGPVQLATLSRGRRNQVIAAGLGL